MIRVLTLATLFEDARVERDAPGRAPTAFRLWQAGRNDSDDGPVFFTKKSAELLLEEQAARGRLYSSDFDHLSLERNRPATAGRASGYHRLEVRPDENGEPELWAIANDWTKDAREGLEQDPPLWRYYSPAFAVDKDGVIVSYINFALCINPKTHKLPELAALRAAAQTGADAMKRSEALALLAKIRSNDASEDEKQEALAALASAFPDGDGEEDKDKKKDEPEEKAEEKAPDSEKKDEKKDAEEPKDEKKAAEDKEPEAKSEEAKRAHAIAADKVGAAITHAVEAAVAERMRPVEIKALLDERVKKDPAMPESFRKMVLASTSLDDAKRILSATPMFPVKRASSPTQGDAAGGGPMLLPDDSPERKELDEGMGIRKQSVQMPTRNADGTLTLHAVRPTDLREHITKKAAHAAGTGK